MNGANQLMNPSLIMRLTSSDSEDSLESCHHPTLLGESDDEMEDDNVDDENEDELRKLVIHFIKYYM